jgi:hypothetical protein
MRTLPVLPLLKQRFLVFLEGFESCPDVVVSDAIPSLKLDVSMQQDEED